MKLLKKLLLSVWVIVKSTLMLLVAALPLALISKIYPKIILHGGLLARFRQHMHNTYAEMDAVWDSEKK